MESLLATHRCEVLVKKGTILYGFDGEERSVVAELSSCASYSLGRDYPIYLFDALNNALEGRTGR